MMHDKKDKDKAAKMDVLKQLRSLMAGAMADDVKGLKKVTVAAKDDEGLEAGLEKAMEILEKKEEMSEEMPDMMADLDESELLEDEEEEEEA